MLDRNGNQYDPNQFFHSAPVKSATPNKDVKKLRVTKVKEVLKEKECPCCKEHLDIAEFTFRDKIYKYCTICRESAAVAEDRAIRDELQKNPLMFSIPEQLRLAKCHGCGRINPIVSDFPVNLTTLTGFGEYCQPNCKGKKPCPR